MRRVAVAGVNTPVGAAVMLHLDGAVEVTGLRTDELSQVDRICQDVTDIVVCGDACCSSWEESSSGRLAEQQVLDACCRTAAANDVRLIFVSGDQVFNGPWVFHDDDSGQFADSLAARRLRALEQQVLQHPRNVVVRTSVLLERPDSLTSRIREALERQLPLSLPAHCYATPLTTHRLALLLDHLLLTESHGIVHLGGAERTSPWGLAQSMAKHLGLDCSRIKPVLNPRPTEQSLRCTRARTEFRLRMPTLAQTADELCQVTAPRILRAA